ncbi:MAG: ABC transporter ATP-binding protein [Candidatus Methanofastidiosia archaeon]
MVNLIEIRGLKTYFYTEDGVVKAIDGIDLDIKEGETLGLVGESGSGKSVTALSILRLVPNPPGLIVDGEIYFRGKNLLEMTEKEMREIRGNKISMIFQDPMTSLNPVFTVGDQIAEAIILHQNLSKRDALKKAVEMMELMGIPQAESRSKDYPHQFSGGMRQRVMTALALSCNPNLLIADEPTTALDVTIQAQVLELMNEIKKEFNTAILYITHDLGLIAETCDDVAVMYAGRITEYGDVESIFLNQKNPYTKALLESIPRLDQERARLRVIRGNVPNLIFPPSGCRFHPRCDYATEICKEEIPVLRSMGDSHLSACHYAELLE